MNPVDTNWQKQLVGISENLKDVSTIVELSGKLQLSVGADQKIKQFNSADLISESSVLVTMS